MKKKILSLILALSMLMAFVPVSVSAYTSTQYGDYLYYKVNDDNTAVTITNCDESATEVIIPSEIDGLPVIAIGDYAFYGCSSITSITIPDSVTTIGYEAFCDCSSITSITIPDSVTTIHYRAFYGCNSLENIYISDIAAWCNIFLLVTMQIQCIMQTSYILIMNWFLISLSLKRLLQ